MALHPTRAAELKVRLDRLKAQEASIQTQLDSIAENGEVSSYKFESAEGSQSVVRRSPKELLSSLEVIQAQIDWITRKINGTGVYKLNIRRFPG